MKTPHWIDIAILAALMDKGQVLELEPLRWKRYLKGINYDGLIQDDRKLLSQYGKVVSAWAQTSPWLDEYIDKETLKELREVSPLETQGSPAELAALLMNEYLFKASSRLSAEVKPGKGPWLVVSGHGLHALTTLPWKDFQDKPRIVNRCNYCGAPFYPSRKTAQFCSPACRTNDGRKAA